jgi:tRNA A-37 threonylcarbamoyl transferase component Bud32
MLKRGDVFRDWLVDLLGERIRNKNCRVAVYKISPASHTVCRYEFEGENYSLVAKFYAEPTGWLINYNPSQTMQREFDILRSVENIINVPRPIAARKDFHCALVTEHIRGKPLYKFMKSEKGLYDRLTIIAHTLRELHDQTKSDYRKQDEFAHFHKILDQLRLDSKRRMEFNRLLGDWWYSTLIDQSYGCRIHNDPNPVNLVFDHDRLIMLDFESSWENANFVHDLGVVAAELKHYFARHKGNDQRAEPYIGHFLWHYSRDKAEFRRITQALPFFMSMGLLRMARLKPNLSYIFKEALACLRLKY